MTLNEIVNFLNGIAWGPWMLILLVGTGIYLSARVGFIQFAKFGYVMKNTLGKLFSKQTAGEGEVTPFQALSTALAATVGTGNIAGVAAAVAASRHGAKTLLMEKLLALGGLGTVGLISWYEPLCDGKGRQMIGGMGEELIKLAVSSGLDDLPAAWGGEETYATPTRTRYSTHFSPTFFSLALDRWVLDAGVELVLDSHATYPVMEGNICRGVITENADGRSFYPAKVVIDATGDASIMHRAGVPCKEGKNYMSYIVHDLTFDKVDEDLAANKAWAIRNWVNAGSDMYGNGQPEEMPLVSGTSAKDVTDYMLTGKRRMLERIKGRDRYSYDIMSIPTMPQFRTIRHIVGDSDFKAINGNSVPDSIGHVGDFRMKEQYLRNVYDMPLSALYHSNFPNLLAAGRIISSPDHDDWEVARVIPTCALTGEAAGKAALRYIRKGSFALDN